VKSRKKVPRENPEWHHEFVTALSNLKDDDIGGSGFAIAVVLLVMKILI
jgi:hypothetical protein